MLVVHTHIQMAAAEQKPNYGFCRPHSHERENEISKSLKRASETRRARVCVTRVARREILYRQRHLSLALGVFLFVFVLFVCCLILWFSSARERAKNRN